MAAIEKKQQQQKNREHSFKETENKALICVDLEPLMTNTCIANSLLSVMYLTVKITEITVNAEILLQLDNSNFLGNYEKDLTKII